MVVVQCFGEEYIFCIDKVLGIIDLVLVFGLEMVWVCELMYWNMDNIVCIEWVNLVISCIKFQQVQLVCYVFDQYWWDLSVQVMIVGKLWDQLEECFLLVYNDLFVCYVSGKDILQSYVMVIVCQESVWNLKVCLLVGVSGLMQIMLGIVMYIVSMFSIFGYSGLLQLLDLEININIGISYLQYVYQQFGNNCIYVLVVYNVGLGWVCSWQGNSVGWIDVVVFVESILFLEICGYVKNVFFYDVYYCYFMGQQDKIFSDVEWCQCY